MRVRTALLATAATIVAIGCDHSLRFRSPERPTRVSASGARASAVVSFAAIDGATGYAIYVEAGATAAPGQARRIVCAAPPCTVDALGVGTSYAIAVATLDDVGESRPSGVVHARPLPRDAAILTRAWTHTAGVELGAALAGVDVNADGFSDVLVGDPRANGDDGSVLIFLGSAAGLADTPSAVLPGPSLSRFGAAIASAGDVNDDLFGDVVIGAPSNASANMNGFVTLLRGNHFGLAPSAAWVSSSFEKNSAAGSAIASGDVDGDGLSDVVFGSPEALLGTNDVGRIDLCPGPGPSSGTTYQSVSTIYGEEELGKFGAAVALTDVDGDGRADAIVGAPFAPFAQLGTGTISVFLSTGEGFVFQRSFLGDDADSQLGTSIAVAGDVDGDGRTDLFVGEPGNHGLAPSGIAVGRVTLFTASGGSLSRSTWSAVGTGDGADLGRSIAGVGDLNADGFDDVVIGEPGFSGSTGRVRVYLGGPAGLSSSANISFQGGAALESFGQAVAAAGDVNGDGFPDFLVGSPGASSVTLILGGAPSTQPRADAGFAIDAAPGANAALSGATFVDEVPGRTYTCTIDWGDSQQTVLAGCTPGGLEQASHAWAKEGHYDVLLHVEASSGDFGEAITEAIVE